MHITSWPDCWCSHQWSSNITAIWLSSASLTDTWKKEDTTSWLVRSYLWFVLWPSHLSFLENREGFAGQSLSSNSVIHVLEDVLTILLTFPFFALYWLLCQRALRPELNWSESPHPFALSWKPFSPCLLPSAQPLKHSICLCLWGGTQPLGLNQWGQIMFSPFSIINSNHPSVARSGAANTSKRRPRRNFSSLLNLNLSTCLSVKTEQPRKTETSAQGLRFQ